MSLFLAYSPEYDLHLPGLSWLHPFDGRKYSHAWELLRQRFGAGLDAAHLIPQEEASRDDLLLAHTREYLDSLHRSRAIANALEIAAARVFPSSILDRSILRPMRLATQGSILAVERALQGHAVFNLGGGYHHAFADHGEGFCIYADAAVALMRARKNGLLHQDDDVLVLDLDAHRGNGTEDIFKDDPHVHFLDLYNFQIYPGYAETEGQSLVPIPSGSNGAFYLRALREELPAFLARIKAPRLAIYNAGSDILEGDPLGRLNVSEAEVRERDRYVLAELLRLAIPFVMLAGGGYTQRSAGLIADAATFLMTELAPGSCLSPKTPVVKSRS